MVHVSSRMLILASSSPYRKELLQRLGLSFEYRSPSIDETPRPGEPPPEVAARLARAKAEVVHRQAPQAVVIGSDQVASLDGIEAVSKPGTHEAATRQLTAASGREVHFHTAWCVLGPDGFVREGVETVNCRYRRLDPAHIERYLRLDEPYDCAGAARCEGLGIALLEWIRSDDPTALIGLPLIAVSGALREAGIDPLAAPSA